MALAKRKASQISTTDDDEPVLSHAEQRRQKKLKQNKDHTIPPPTKNSGLKRQNSVWVGNLSFKTTPISLKSFFDGVGEITRINMPMKPPDGKGPRENSGFAYIDFATKDSKVVALTMSEQNLEGRRLLIKDGDDYSTKPAPQNGGTAMSKTAQKILSDQKQPSGPTLFFGNLSFQTTEDSIREFLEVHRTKPLGNEDTDAAPEGNKGTKKDVWIRRIRMGTFEDTGVCKGWAFVDFMTTEHATAVLVNPRNHTLDGRKLKVEFASPEAVRRGGGPGDHKHSKKDNHGNDKWSSDSPQKRPRVTGRKSNVDNKEVESTVPETRSATVKIPLRTKTRAPPRRMRPGAALAQAQRTTAAIIPSQGRKITF